MPFGISASMKTEDTLLGLMQREGRQEVEAETHSRQSSGVIGTLG